MAQKVGGEQIGNGHVGGDLQSSFGKMSLERGQLD